MVEINEALVLAIAILGWIGFRVYTWRTAGRVNFGREIVANGCFFYLLFVFHLTFFPMNIVLYSFGPARANFDPLFTTRNMLRYLSPYTVIQVLGNLFLLAPLGLFLPVLGPKFRHWGAILGAGFLVTLTIEIFQYFLAVRVFDIDDLILNTLGVSIGFLLYRLLAKIPALRRWLDDPNNHPQKNTPWLVYGLVFLLAFLAIFGYQLWSQTDTQTMLLDEQRAQGQHILAQRVSGRYFLIFSESAAGVKKVDYFRQVILDRYTPVQYIEGLNLAKDEFAVSGTAYSSELMDYFVIARSDQDIAALTSQAERFPVFASQDYYFGFASLPVNQPDAYFSFGFIDSRGNALDLRMAQ